MGGESADRTREALALLVVVMMLGAYRLFGGFGVVDVESSVNAGGVAEDAVGPHGLVVVDAAAGNETVTATTTTTTLNAAWVAPPPADGRSGVTAGNATKAGEPGENLKAEGRRRRRLRRRS